MKSIAQSIDGFTIAAEIRMERQTHKGAFLLLEGATDILRFDRFVDESKCSFVNCYGKPNVMDAVERLYDDGVPGIVGMIDADFDRLLSVNLDHEGWVVSHCHDFDLDVASTSVFERYLLEVADKKKISNLGGARKFFDHIIKSLKPLTAMRFANQKHSLGYSLTDLRIEEFYDGQSIDIPSMIDAVSWGKFSDTASKRKLNGLVDRYRLSNIDLIQATCGHDFCEALGISLRGVAGSRRTAQTLKSEIEIHFRLAFDLEAFREMPSCAAIVEWQKANAPYLILTT